MDKITEQMGVWAGEFGRSYTDRTNMSAEGLDELYLPRFGVTRTQLNESFLEGLDPTIPILEVGCGIGTQLLSLQRSGFSDLSGVELQSYAGDIAKSRCHGINITQGSAFSLPFPDASFDLVFTSGVLIHIAPSDLREVMSEIHRCTREYIWGYEYYADEMTEVEYRGNNKLLWKTDYSSLYQEWFGCTLVKIEKLKYSSDENVDQMFLLRKNVAEAANEATTT